MADRCHYMLFWVPIQFSCRAGSSLAACVFYNSGMIHHAGCFMACCRCRPGCCRRQQRRQQPRRCGGRQRQQQQQPLRRQFRLRHRLRQPRLRPPPHHQARTVRPQQRQQRPRQRCWPQQLLRRRRRLPRTAQP